MRLFWLPSVCMNPPGDDYFRVLPGDARPVPGEPRPLERPAGSNAVVVHHAGRCHCQGEPPSRRGHALRRRLRVRDGVRRARSVQPRRHQHQQRAHDSVRLLRRREQPARSGRFRLRLRARLRLRESAQRQPRHRSPLDRGRDGRRPGGHGRPLHGLRRERCSTSEIDTVVPGASWEVDPGTLSPPGHDAHEAIWVDYYASGGQFDDDSVVLFDALAGRCRRPGTATRRRSRRGRKRCGPSSTTTAAG